MSNYPQFEKETFKKNVKDNVKTLFRKNLKEATPQQVDQAVCYTVKDAVIDDWLASQDSLDKKDPKIVYYINR